MRAVLEATLSRQVVEKLVEFFQLPRPYVDVTYGKGGFWSRQLRPDFATDINGGPDGVATWERIQRGDHSVGTLFFDPPHVLDQGANSSLTRYGEANNWSDAGFNMDTYRLFFLEARRVLRLDGWLVVKTADMVHNHRPYWLTLDTAQIAREAGFQLFDWLIAHRPTLASASDRWAANHHLRKHHSHWLLWFPPGRDTKR